MRSRNSWNSGELAALPASWPRNIDRDDFTYLAGPVGNYGDAVSERNRLVDAVGDENGRLAGLGHDPRQLVLHHLARHRVDRGEWLVHQQQPWLSDQSAGQSHTLSHAT